MESAGAKLNIVFSTSFLAAFCEATEQARQSGNDDTLHQYFNLKSLLFRFSDQRRVLVNNGIEVTKGDFERVLTEFSMDSRLRNESVSRNDQELHVPDNFDSVVLMNAPPEQLTELSSRKGILTSNCQLLQKVFAKATLNWYYNIPVPLDENELGKTEVSLDNLFTEYRLPSNQFVLLDPYLYNWSEKYISKNIPGLIKSIIKSESIDDGNRLLVTLISTFPINLGNSKGAFEFCPDQRKNKVNQVYSIVKNEIGESLNCDITVLFIDQYQLNKDIKKIKEAKKNGQEYNKATLDRLINFHKFCKKYIHDRWFYTNYLYCDSGRGYELDITRFWYKMNLFSQFQDEHFKIRKTYEELVYQLKAYSTKRELGRYIYFGR